METNYFRVSEKEYCHITEDTLFIFNSKVPTRIPLEDELSNAWSVKSILNYIVFVFLLAYVSLSLSRFGSHFFYKPVNYGALILLFMALMRIKEGSVSSNTPTIPRNKIRNALFKTPRFSYPRLVIYFEAPDGKILRRSISVLYPKEALPVLKGTGVLTN